jgi:hypothetical protein
MSSTQVCSRAPVPTAKEEGTHQSYPVRIYFLKKKEKKRKEIFLTVTSIRNTGLQPAPIIQII